MRSIRLIAIAILAVLGISMSFVSTASANSHGQCNSSMGDTESSTKEWIGDLKVEGALPDATRQIFKPAGYDSGDQSVSQWMRDRVIIAPAARPTKSGQDYMCHGNMTKYKKTKYAKGKQFFVVLPDWLKKGDFARHKTKRFTVRKVIAVRAIGLVDCGNGYWVMIYIVIYEKGGKSPVHHHPAPRPTPTPTTPAPAPEQPTTPEAPKAPEKPACVIEVSGTNNGQIACGDITSTCTINGSQVTDSSICSDYKNCVASQDSTWDSEQNVCVKKEVPPPTCEELHNCPPPPAPQPSASASMDCSTPGIVVRLGNTGNATATFSVNGATYTVGAGGSKQVTVPVAEDTTVHVTVTSGGDTFVDQDFHRDCEQPPPPQPTCEEQGKIGTYPNCTYPQPTLSLTTPNDVEVDGTYPYRVGFTVPQGYQARLTFGAKYGNYSNTGDGTVQFVVSGSGVQSATYTAPGEVPQDSNGKDWMIITIQLVKDGNLVGDPVTQTSDPFTVAPVAGHPL